jgi:hypothetical protein
MSSSNQSSAAKWNADVLLIQYCGVLSDGDGYLGYAVGADNNAAIISGSGRARIKEKLG